MCFLGVILFFSFNVHRKKEEVHQAQIAEWTANNARFREEWFNYTIEAVQISEPKP